MPPIMPSSAKALSRLLYAHGRSFSHRNGFGSIRRSSSKYLSHLPLPSPPCRYGNSSNIWNYLIDREVGPPLIADLNCGLQRRHFIGVGDGAEGDVLSKVYEENHVKNIREYRKKVESELSEICADIMTVIDEHLIPSSSVGESNVFYYKMKGDYYRYMAEFKAGDDRKEVAELSLKAYQAASTTAEADLSPTHPIRLGLALNFSVFYYEIMNSP